MPALFLLLALIVASATPAGDAQTADPGLAPGAEARLTRPDGTSVAIIVLPDSPKPDFTIVADDGKGTSLSLDQVRALRVLDVEKRVTPSWSYSVMTLRWVEVTLADGRVISGGMASWPVLALKIGGTNEIDRTTGWTRAGTVIERTASAAPAATTAPPRMEPDFDFDDGPAVKTAPARPRPPGSVPMAHLLPASFATRVPAARQAPAASACPPSAFADHFALSGDVGTHRAEIERAFTRAWDEACRLGFRMPAAETAVSVTTPWEELVRDTSEKKGQFVPRDESVWINTKTLDDAEGLAATAAHEFLHRVQWGYTPLPNPPHLWFDEAVAIWFEELLVGGSYHSVIRDGHEWAPFMGLAYPATHSFKDASQFGYGMTPLVQFLAARRGRGPRAIPAIYARLARGESLAVALEAEEGPPVQWWGDFLRAYIGGELGAFSANQLLRGGSNSGWTSPLALRWSVESDADHSRASDATFDAWQTRFYRVDVTDSTLPKDATLRVVARGTASVEIFRINRANADWEAGARATGATPAATRATVRSTERPTANAIFLVAVTNHEFAPSATTITFTVPRLIVTTAMQVNEGEALPIAVTVVPPQATPISIPGAPPQSTGADGRLVVAITPQGGPGVNHLDVTAPDLDLRATASYDLVFPLSSFEALVVDKVTGSPVTGAKVTLVGPSGTIVLMTDGEGQVATDRIKRGDYSITVTADGYHAASRSPFTFTSARKHGTVRIVPVVQPPTTVAAAPQTPSAAPAPPAASPSALKRTLSFGSAYIPKPTKPSPQTFTFEAPSAGSITVMLVYRPKEYCTFEYGAFHTLAELRWSGPSGTGWRQADATISTRGQRESVAFTHTIAVKAPGTITFSAMSETTQAYQNQGRWIDINLSSWATHYKVLAGTMEVELQFTPSPTS